MSRGVRESIGWYNRNTGHNPYTREGKKTCAFEIAEQLDWRIPDWIFVSVGDGNILSGTLEGLRASCARSGSWIACRSSSPVQAQAQRTR